MLDNISIDLCQSILNKASDSSLHEESQDFDDVFDAGEILSLLSNKINEISLSKEFIIKSTAACIWTLKSSTSIDDCIVALTIYHQLMRSAVFGSLGCRSLGIRKFVFLSFCKIAMKTLKGVECSGPAIVSDAADEDFAIEVVNEQSQRHRRQASQSSQAKATTKRSKQSLSNKKGLSIFAKLLEESLCTLLENTDEDFVSIISESLVFLLEMSIFTDDWKNSSQPIASLFKVFVKLASETTLSLHQCIMPGLSYCFDRSSIYSDSAGIRAAVHNALVEIYAPMTAELLSAPFKSIISRSRNSLPGNVSFEASAVSSRATTPAKSNRGTPATTPGSAKSVRSTASGAMDVDDESQPSPSSKEFSTGQECLLSALQRMTLLCPDRANIRQVVAKSISLIINAIVHDTNRTVANKVLGHYVQFLTRLARSQRAQHRSFALEIICIMIQEENIWSSGVDHLELFQVLIARSLDQSPVVRLKALSTIYDFMENAEDSNRLTMLYELVMGTARGCNGASLLDAARTATTETKPMLRAKALQVLTCILTKEWIRPTAVTELAKANDEEDYFRLTLMDDDLQAIVAAFSDPSIAVRKQAVHCLTEVLKAHPSSPSALSTWVMTALPLIIDTEATVVQKVASVFEDVVLSALHEDVTTDNLSLGWKALYKIGECNMIQILKHIVGYMIRQGGITFERSGPMSFFRLVNMCKIHCETGLSSSVVVGHADTSSATAAADVEETLNATTRTMAATEAPGGTVPLEHIYYEASWILLEAFASHCALKVNNARGQLISVEEQFQKVGSATFVYDAFRAHCQHTEVCAMSMHQEDNFLRILKVLDKFLSTLAEDELALVSQEIKTRLMSLSIQAPVAALMISIQYQIAKVQSEQRTTTATANRMKMTLATRVTAWVTPLLEKIFQQLKSFAFGANGSNVTMNNLSQFSQSQDVTSSLPSMRIVQIGLFIIGELSMLGFQLDEAPLKMLMKTGDVENDQTVPLVTITQDITGAVRVRFATRLSEMLQLFMAKTLPGADGHGMLRCPQPVRAVAFITVGKLCMRDHILARDALNVFLRELTCDEDSLNTTSEVSVSALTEQSFITQSTMATKNSVRNNALLVLADLCVRHTHLVDRHIDTLACCLQDRDVMIRRNALMLISQLLMQDFVKLKGLLLYRFLMLTVDDDEELAVFAKEVIERSLCVKYNGILVNHFSEALIILNKCSEHPIYSAVAFAVGQDNGHPNGGSGAGAIDDHVFSQAFAMDTSAIELDPNTKAFHASNDLTRAQRFQIFNFMAANINDETKIQITAKLVNDILASAVDHSQRLLPDRNNIPISSSAMKKYGNNQRDSFGGITPSAKTLVDFTRFETAIEDVFIFLRSPVLKIGAKKKQGSEQDDVVMMDDAAEQAAATTAGQIAQAKTKILKALSSQHMVSHVLPVVVSLKHVLEQLKSPLQGALMEYLLYLVKHHASEVDQALQYDPTLKAEIEFDLRQFERQRKEQAQQQQQQQQARLNGGPMSAIKRSSNMPTPHLDRVVAAMTSSSSVTNSAIRPSTVQKPVLLKSASKQSVTASERKVPGSVRFHDSVRGSTSSYDDEDPMLRVMSQPDEIAPEEFIANHHDTTNLSGISHRLSSSSGRELSNLSLLSDSDVLGESNTSLSRGNSAQKRRSWGVVLPTFGSRTGSSDEGDENRLRGNEQLLSASGLGGDNDDETPARKRSRTHSRSNSLGGRDSTGSAALSLSAQSVKSSRLSSSSTSSSASSSSSKKISQQPVFLMMKKDTAPAAVSTKSLINADESLINESLTTVPKKLDFIFADIETTSKERDVAATIQPLMPPPAPVMGGKRSAKVATNSLMMAMR